MKRAGRWFVAGVAAMAVGLVSGCGERSQVVVYKSGKYQGKKDTNPWDGAPGASPYTTSKWTAGDRASWETAINTRAQGQNEYTRTE